MIAIILVRKGNITLYTWKLLAHMYGYPMSNQAIFPVELNITFCTIKLLANMYVSLMSNEVIFPIYDLKPKYSLTQYIHHCIQFTSNVFSKSNYHKYIVVYQYH